ncbi:SusC/RagA family TonB-linked outer membrane protein [Chryseobacterium lathyri]|uniref:SusC/RagA family TonB-linked outer membrane protein n=1 Tax=Chryseobacterium lathyri TaxID=395933 RepID=A0A511YEZ5_9FLAO|nr:SusC/RagA family TonB-linked outer membrane protein [Chryseobacterium lathyri]GEN73753.1 SusC/RagA family TonB-linked outer membrane protein [Chryseobacterium lathyri]
MKNICTLVLFLLLGITLVSGQQKNHSQMRVNYEAGKISAIDAVKGFLMENKINAYAYSTDHLKNYRIQGVKCNNESVLDCLRKILKGLPFEALIYQNTVIIRQKPQKVSADSNKEEVTPLLAIDQKEEDTTALSNRETKIEEITLNAGYYSVKDKERTGSIAKVTAKDIENQPVNNVLSTLQGRMAGVSITQNSGVPGGGFDIQIRGKNSLRYDGSFPLIVIDGVPANSQSNAIGSLSNGIIPKGEASPLNALNMNDIESIEVLKDADATAIYGSRGANGVVLITTKKGKNQVTSYVLDLNTSVSKTSRFLELANTEQYLQMRKDAYKNDGITNYPANTFDLNGTWDRNRYTDWYKEFIGKTFLNQQAQLSVSGGNELTRFFMSVNHLEQSTAYGNGFRYQKMGIDFSATHQSKDKKFTISPTILYSYQRNNLFEADLTNQVFLTPNAPAIYLPDGTLNWANNTFANPLAKLNNEYKNKIYTLYVQLTTEYKISKDFMLKLSGGFTNTDQKEVRTNPSTASNPSLGRTSRNSVIYFGNVNRYSWILEPQLHWTKKWKRHQFNALLGSTFESKNEELFRVQGSDFTSNDLIYNLSNAKIQKVNEDTETAYRYMAIFGRFNYGFLGRYFVNLTARRDGSSRFGSNNRFANFGAVGTAWIFSKEEFLKDNPIVSFGKLRGSYGIAGSDLIGDYQFLNTYTISSTFYDGNTGLYPSRLYNPNFSWEKTKKLETALELGLLQDKISITASWYRNRSSNQLVGIPLPSTTGFPTILSNFPATVQNSGFEFDLGFSPVQKTPFKWSTSLNLSIPKSKLLAFDNIASTTYANSYIVGASMNIKKVYEFKGINPTTGIYQFTDLNGDGKIDINDRTKTVKYGTRLYGGLTGQFSYKKISLGFLLQFAKQNLYSLDYSLPGIGTMRNIPTYMLDYWTPEHTNGSYQLPTTGLNSDAVKAQTLYQNSDAAIVDASFVRLNNIQLSYAVPLKELSMILTLQGQNLFTITGYKGLSPEAEGIYLPFIKTYSFNITLKF